MAQDHKDKDPAPAEVWDLAVAEKGKAEANRADSAKVKGRDKVADADKVADTIGKPLF